MKPYHRLGLATVAFGTGWCVTWLATVSFFQATALKTLSVALSVLPF